MSALKIKGGFIVLFLFMMILNACVPVYTGVGDYSDRENYLQLNFAKENLPKEITETVESNEFSQPGFSKITIHYDVIYEKLGEESVTQNLVVTNLNAGNGFIQQTSEMLGNGIPYELEYRINYLNLLTFKEQDIDITRKKEMAMTELKHLHHSID